jgi:hypothetical protein
MMRKAGKQEALIDAKRSEKGRSNYPASAWSMSDDVDSDVLELSDRACVENC